MLTVARAMVLSLGTLAILAACKAEGTADRAAPLPSSTPSAASAPLAAGDGDAFEREVRFESEGKSLVGWLLKPAGTGPFPAIVYNHGSERDPSLRWMGETASFFRAHGYVAFFPFRRGAGGSEGTYWKDEVDRRTAAGEREDQATIEAMDAENADVASSVAFVRAHAWVDGRRIAVGGCSFGGIQTLLAAERPLGLFAAVDFAGASFSWAGNALLRERLTTAVDEAKAPVFFLQAENDHDTTPSKALSAEMTRAGKANRMKIYPPHGATEMEGHAHFCNHGQGEWGEDVLSFLREAPPKGG